jgi:hypothetical protein
MIRILQTNDSNKIQHILEKVGKSWNKDIRVQTTNYCLFSLFPIHEVPLGSSPIIQESTLPLPKISPTIK